MRLFERPLVSLVESMAYYDSLRALWGIVEKRFDDPELTLLGVSSDCGISHNRLNMRLNEVLEMTFHEFLTRYRLLQAVRIMHSKDWTILEIALNTGFGNVRSFERYFKKLLGAPPREFRDRLRPRRPPPS